MKSMLLLASVWPEPGSSAAGLRDHGLIRAFQRHNVQVTVASHAKNEKGLAETRKLGVPCHEILLNDSSFEEWLQTLLPDVVIFDRFITEEQFGARVRAILPQALCVLDTQDLHFLRGFRKKAEPFSKAVPPLTDEVLRELASIYRCDHSWLVSSFEKNLLTEHYQIPKALTSTLRFFYEKPSPALPYSRRVDFSWVGNFRHAPNHDSIFYLVDKIWPKIRHLLPEEKLRIYGAYPPDGVMRLHSPANGIHVMGEAADLLDVFSKTRVSLAPLRFGAGIKGKISDSWYYGTPVVTTSVGEEGMADGEFPAIVADHETAFAEQAAALYQDESLWNRIQSQAWALLEKSYSFHQADIAVEHLQELQTNLNAFRQGNIVGQILWLNTLRSTEYFSRWIEAKNKSSLA